MPGAFAPDPWPSAAPLFAGAALLDAEKLRVYQLAVEFQQIEISRRDITDYGRHHGFAIFFRRS